MGKNEGYGWPQLMDTAPGHHSPADPGRCQIIGQKSDFSKNISKMVDFQAL